MFCMTRLTTPRSLLRLAAATATVGALVLATGCGDDDEKSDPATTPAPAAEITITGQWARTSPAAVTRGAAYVTITSPIDDKLVDVSVDGSVAAMAQIHEMAMAETTDTTMGMGSDTTMGMGSDTTMAMGEGEMVMREVDSIDLPAGVAVELKPGGYHIMLMELAKPLEVGTTIQITLVFEKAGSITIDVPVLDEAP